jgi:hypothetical protein
MIACATTLSVAALVIKDVVYAYEFTHKRIISPPSAQLDAQTLTR